VLQINASLAHLARGMHHQRHLGLHLPQTLKRCGADPATASSIFLTTATDVVSMGMLPGLATTLVR